MDKSQDSTLARNLHRRLAPVKLAIQMLHHEIDLGSESRVPVGRAVLESLASTLELFVEDVEAEIGSTKGALAANGDRRPTLLPEKAVPRLNG